MTDKPAEKVEAKVEVKAEPKEAKVRKVKCYTLNSIYLERNGDIVKVKAGEVYLLTRDEYDHFHGKVTKDIPKELEAE